jgi:hypothetical protein
MTGGSVSESAQQVDFAGIPANLAVATNTISVQGALHGSSSISVEFNSGPQTFGTFSGNTLVLSFPQTDGTVAPVTFHEASASQYNQAVGNLHASVDASNQTYLNEQQIRKEQQAIENDAAALNTDFNSFKYFLPSDVTSVHAAVQQEESDLATTNTMSKNVGQVCENAGRTDDEAGVVQDDAGTVENKTYAVATDISSTPRWIQEVQADQAKLQFDEAVLPTYPASAPSAEQVADAVAGYNRDIASAISSVNTDIDSANSDAATAMQVANQALASINDCGVDRTPPVTIQHLS